MEISTILKEYRKDLTDVGFKELLTPLDVDKFMEDTSDNKLVVINSVCGCAAGSARPGVKLAIQDVAFYKVKRIATVFAGQDISATVAFREYIPEIPPSSPSFYIFKNDALMYVYPRHFIESRDPEEISEDLVEAIEEYL
mgnify:CR=1 FL=1